MSGVDTYTISTHIIYCNSSYIQLIQYLVDNELYYFSIALILPLFLTAKFMFIPKIPSFSEYLFFMT